MQDHRGIDWYLRHLLPVVGCWAFTGFIIGQHLWKTDRPVTATQGAFLLAHVLFFGVASLLTELGSRPLLARLARGAPPGSPSRRHLAVAGALGGLVPLTVFGLWYLILGLPTTLGWFSCTVFGFWILAASNAVGIVRAESMNRRREALEAEALGGVVGAPYTPLPRSGPEASTHTR